MNRGTYTVVKGDATTPKSDYLVILPHVCNTLGKWGAGFTGALDNRFGFGPKDQYLCRLRMLHDNAETELLGHISIAQVASDKIRVINMIAQAGVKGDTPSKIMPPIRYWALASTMCKVAFYIESLKHANHNCKIHCPKFGSDLAGGKWEFIEILIQEIWIEAGIDVTVYEYDG